MRIDTDWLTTPLTDDLVRGVWELERTDHGVRPHRLPARARTQAADPQLAMVEAQSSGVRLAFRTATTEIELDVLITRYELAGLPARPDGVFELVVDGEVVAQDSITDATRVVRDMATGGVEQHPAGIATVRFPGLSDGAKEVEIWLPHTETVELVALRTDAPVESATESGRRVWLHHGSSISHGSNSTHPTGIWPVIAAAAGDVELVNLGLGGSALLDPFTARAMRDTAADVISVKMGINLVNGDLMRLRAFTPAVHGFLDTIREGHPTTPLLVVSPTLCPMCEDTPGPGSIDVEAARAGQLKFISTGDPAEVAAGKLTLTVIRAELARIVAERAADDPNLHYLDGRSLYGEADFAELPLPDRLHPDTAAHRRIGERFAALVFADGAPLA